MNKDKNKELVQRYWAFVKPYKFIIILIIVLGIMSFSVPLAIPWFTKILID